MEEYVILVDENDKELGTQEKLLAHKEGVLHRAFSIFLFDSDGQMLLQKRAQTKYHSPGLWTNACCSHPRQKETTESAAHRRLKEELGFDCFLKKSFSFIYRADVGGGLIEHEFDHVFTGIYSGSIGCFNPDEVEVCRWIAIPELQKEIEAAPHMFTPWFLIAARRIFSNGAHCLS